MKTIFRIFVNDLRTISRNVIAFVVIIGICILPALYSWFNIASNWDPYSATSGLVFAVASNDEGYSYKSLKVNAGDKIIDALKANPKMGWDFVSEAEAVEGVKAGRYYAAVVIPKTFSKDLCSITTGEFNQSRIAYYSNEKKNAIAPKITTTGVNTVIGEVKAAYVETITNIIATTLNLTTDEIESNKTDILKKAEEGLDEIVVEIDTFNGSIDVFCSTIDTLEGLLKTNKELLPKIDEKLSGSGQLTNDVGSAIAASRKASAQLTDSIGSVIAASEELQGNIDEQIVPILDSVEEDSGRAADKLVKLTAINNKIISFNNGVLSMLSNISSRLGIDLTRITTRLEQANERQRTQIAKINSAADTIRKTGALPKQMRDELLSAIAAEKSELAAISAEFTNAKNTINKVIDDAYTSLEGVNELLGDVKNDIPVVTGTLDSTMTSLEEMKKTFRNVQTNLNKTKDKVNNLITKAKELKDETRTLDFVRGIISEPEDLSRFVADPVETETIRLYPIDNYGSAMSPFYTSLGIWVGGIVLVAVVRAELTNRQKLQLKKYNQTQLFFGRYLMFFVLSQLQALIIALGDLYFLGIQCNDHFLFIFGSMFSAFVYTTIIYSLTITFNVIGKALAVIILVLQVAGSGGTFPVEVLPQPFQSIVPYLPFRYGNDILREAIAGPDIGNYWRNVLFLLAFVPFALVIGLLLRRPCIRIMDFFEKRIHQSDLII